jgi:hypothetical protein
MNGMIPLMPMSQVLQELLTGISDWHRLYLILLRSFGCTKGVMLRFILVRFLFFVILLTLLLDTCLAVGPRLTHLAYAYLLCFVILISALSSCVLLIVPSHSIGFYLALSFSLGLHI